MYWILRVPLKQVWCLVHPGTLSQRETEAIQRKKREPCCHLVVPAPFNTCEPISMRVNNLNRDAWDLCHKEHIIHSKLQLRLQESSKVQLYPGQTIMTLDDNDRIIGAMDHRIKKLQERYPFSAEELEILCRCHDHIKNAADRNDFLMKLAQTSPYQFFFLPGDEMRTRVDWIESFILPSGFANQLRAAVSMDAFVAYASQDEDKSLEHFLEGVAVTGRRGSKEALRFIYRLFDQPEPEELIDVCVRLAVASDALVTPVLDQEATLLKLGDLRRATESMAQSLREACSDETMTAAIFVEWAENNFPMLHAPLATFVHHLLFHGHPFPSPRIPYVSPQLDTDSRVLSDSNQNPLLMAISMMSSHFGGKVRSMSLFAHSWQDARKSCI